MFSRSVAKYRPHRPHHHECSDLQVFRAGGTIMGYRPPVDRYRAQWQVPTAYRPARNVEFCRALILCVVPAVGILTSSIESLRSLSVCPSAGTIPMHRSQRLHPSPIGVPGSVPRVALAVGKSSWGISVGPYNKRATKTGRRATMPVEDLRQSEMMSHLLDALDKGEDIGHYGRLTFAMVAHHFLDKEELVEWLSKDSDTDEREARALVQQVEERGSITRPSASASSSGRTSRSSPSARTPTIRTPATSTGS